MDEPRQIQKDVTTVYTYPRDRHRPRKIPRLGLQPGHVQMHGLIKVNPPNTAPPSGLTMELNWPQAKSRFSKIPELRRLEEEEGLRPSDARLEVNPWRRCEGPANPRCEGFGGMLRSN